MTRKPFTLRIDDAERAALKNSSKVEGRTINQLLNEAVKNYLSRQGRKERSWEATLEALRKYGRQNGRFQRAVAAFVEAEARLDDPLEGELMEGQLVERRFKPAGPVQIRIRKLLSRNDAVGFQKGSRKGRKGREGKTPSGQIGLLTKR